MTYATLDQAMNSKNAVVISERDVNARQGRKVLRVRKANGKKFYMVVAYENGTFSSPVTY